MPNQAYIETHEPTWEYQPYAEGLPGCWLLKIEGHPYPYGSIVETGAPMFPRYACKAFECDEQGRQNLIWVGEEATIQAAQDAVSKHLDHKQVDNLRKVA